jgi:hypothetical protein
MPLFSAGHNQPGYLPDSEPVVTRDWQLARDTLIDDLRFAADATETWADPHDCDDVPCPTYGDDCPDNLAAGLRAAADELATSNPDAGWQATVGREVWWLDDIGDHCPDCGYHLAAHGWPTAHHLPDDGGPCPLHLDDDGTASP